VLCINHSGSMLGRAINHERSIKNACFRGGVAIDHGVRK